MSKKCLNIIVNRVTFANGYICAGINKTPKLHPLDKICLCIKSDICNRKQEMTIKEAAIICSLLTQVMAELSPSIKRRLK
jgi:hypothetical protein